MDDLFIKTMRDIINSPDSATEIATKALNEYGERVYKGATALYPLVQHHNMSVNPEDLQFMSYVVLQFADSSLSYAEIQARVEDLIAEDMASHARMQNAMQNSIDAQKG